MKYVCLVRIKFLFFILFFFWACVRVLQFGAMDCIVYAWCCHISANIDPYISPLNIYQKTFFRSFFARIALICSMCALRHRSSFFSNSNISMCFSTLRTGFISNVFYLRFYIYLHMILRTSS